MRWMMMCLCVLWTASPMSAETREPVMTTVVLTNGDVVTGPITTQDDLSLTLDHPVLGPITIPTEQVQSTTPIPPQVEPGKVAQAASDAATAVAQGKPAPPLADADLATQAQEETIEEVKPGLFGTRFLRGWTKTIQLGFSGTQGNTRTLSVNAGTSLFYEDEHDRWDFKTQFDYKQDRGTNTTNKLFVSLQKDWLLPEHDKWFIFAQGRYDHDQFQSWNHRVSGAAGIGYQFVKNDTWELRGKLGGGASKEFGSNQNAIVPELLGGLSGAWNLTDQMKIVASTEAYKGLLEMDQFRTLSSIAYLVALDKKYGLNLKLGLDHEYQNVVSAGRDRHDVTYYGALMMDF